MRQNLDKRTWTKARVSLNNTYDYSNTSWKEVIDLFEKRVDDFYFTPIKQILTLGKQQGEGFSILTLQCALIEMFAAFRQGKIHNRSKPETGGLKYEYRDSSACFVEFLHTEKIFENIFYRIDKKGDKQKNQPFSASGFYGNVRCGLMHEGRTKKDWLITTKTDNGFSSLIFIVENKDKTKSINRTILNKRLEYYFREIYLRELRQKDDSGSRLRRLFARKLDHLYDISRDINYDWWIDR